MRCTRCGHLNPEDARFCNQCGSEMEVPFDPEEIYFGVFYPGGHGDGYTTSFAFQASAEEAMKWQNSPAVLSNSSPDQIYFLGEIQETALLPEDKAKHIPTRVKVLRWWTLEFKSQWFGVSGGKDITSPPRWEIGEELQEHPDTLGLSNLE